MPRGVQQDQDKTGLAKLVRVVLSVFPGMSPGVMGELSMSDRIEALMRLKKVELVERLLVAEDRVAVLNLGAAAKAALDAPPPVETASVAEPVVTVADMLRAGDARYYVDGDRLVVSVPGPNGRQLFAFRERTFGTPAARAAAMERFSAHIAAGGQLTRANWERFTLR